MDKVTQETATQQPDSVMAEGHVIAGVQRLVHETRTYKCDEVHLGQRLVLISIGIVDWRFVVI